MTDQSNLRDALLKQDEITPATSVEIRNGILAQDRRRVRRMKWMAGTCWVVFLTVFLLALFADYFRQRGIPLLGSTTDEMMRYFPEVAWFMRMSVVIVQILFVLTVMMMFSLQVRWRTLTMHQIQASLAGIEEQLRKMSENRP